MKKILFTIMVLAVGCSEDKNEPNPNVNNVEVIQIGTTDNMLNVAVDYFYARAAQSNITVEKGLTVKTFSAPQAGDQTKVSGKVIELDKEFIEMVSISGYQCVQVHIAKQIGKVYFPSNLECVNKIDFSNQSQLVNQVAGKSDSFTYTILGFPDQCPI